VSKAGILATSLHVVDGAKQVSVRQSGSQAETTGIDLIASDTQHDLALLRLAGKACIPLVLGDSDNIQPGQRIFVLGNPLARRDLASSISDGLVSGIRHLEDYGTALQISAPLSPGNSGGPVLDETGRTLGIVAFKLTAGELLNFAIPVNYLRAMLRDPAQNPVLFSWTTNPTGEAYRSKAYRIPDRASSIFASAQAASGTCQLKDASWTSSYEQVATHQKFQVKSIEKGDFGLVRSRIGKDKSGTLVSFVSGKSINGRWRKKDGKIVSTEPLSEDDIVGHMVDNWYCFCPGPASLWRDITISEEIFEGEQSFKVGVKEPFFGSPVVFWFGKQEQTVIGREYLLKTNSIPQRITDSFSDFRMIEGYKIPFKTVKKIDGVLSSEETVTSFKANVGYPEYMFEP
jgi:hypothetical protein